MPIPFILGAVAVVAGGAGIGAGVYGGKKIYDAKHKVDAAKDLYELSKQTVVQYNKRTIERMDWLGSRELEILRSFENFSNLIEKIQNRPKFEEIQQGNIDIPKFTPEELKQASVGAAILLGGLGGAGAGAAGGFAASGAATAAVMALGTASTGTAIGTLSGVAATNATLALLGGGTIAAGGGGVALGSMLLGASTLGVGLLIGGAIFAFSGSKISDKADEAWSQAQNIAKDAEVICKNLEEISDAAYRFRSSLEEVYQVYLKQFSKLDTIVDKKVDYDKFDVDDRKILQNTILLVGLLYEMCKVKITKKSPYDDKCNVANHQDIRQITDSSEVIIKDITN